MKSKPLRNGPNSRSPSHGGWLLVLDFGVSDTRQQATAHRPRHAVRLLCHPVTSRAGWRTDMTRGSRSVWRRHDPASRVAWLGGGVFVFFLVKGLLWLSVPALLALWRWK